MVGNDKESRDTGYAPGGSEAGENGLPPDTGGSPQDGGKGQQGSGLAKGTPCELADKGGQKDEKSRSSDFVNYVARRVGGKSSVFQTMWAAMLQEAPSYLLDEKKPINLGFGELYALPYRANWREIMHAKFPRLIQSLRKTPSALKQPFLINIGWDSELFNSDLVEMKDGDKHHGWCVMFAPNEQWFKIVRAYEKDQRASLGARKYTQRFTRLVRRFTNRVLKYFLNHATQTSISAAAVRHGSGTSGDYLVPHTPKGRVRPTAPEIGPTFIVSGDPGKEAEEREEGALYGSFKEVPPMPLIPSSPKDLWERDKRDSEQ